jgi:Cd2+/Zn2+-exporting ATPase/Cu+-exporting ATPase
MKATMKTLDVKIKGMDCADCTTHVKKAIQSVPDVEFVDVFLGAEKARITYNWTPPDLKLVETAVKSAGYEAVIDEEETAQESPSQGQISANKFLIVLGLIMGMILFVTVTGEWLGLFEQVTNIIPWYIWLAAVIAGGWPIFMNVARAAVKGQIISHSLMTLGVIAAIAVGEWPTAAVVVLFMRVGDFVEGFTTGKARSAVRNLTELAPRRATVLRNGNEEILPIDEVKIGDTVIVRPGEAIPVDSEVISGSASINQSAISGESMPVDVEPGARVFAASMLLTGMLKVNVTATGMDSTFGKVIQLVEEAEANRADVQRAADKFAGYYLPIVAGIALLTYLLRNDPLAAAATLVVACSCSFALATPIAMLASVGSAARHGILIKGGKHIETLEKINTLFVDKTGTLTLGKPEITDVFPLGKFKPDELVQLAASAERYSEHPLGKAVVSYAENHSINLLDAKDFESKPGVGVEARIGKNKVVINNKFSGISLQVEHKIEELSAEGKSLFFIQINGKPAGIISAEDEPRRDVKEALEKLKKNGIERIVLISGDREPAVRKLALELGIDYHAELSPEDKHVLLHNAESRGEVVAMIGDGINDAPALASADVGIAMGETGSQIAIEAAHVTLMREDWSLVPELFDISKRAMRVVRMNILFTALYNLVGLSLAAFGILPPVLAAAAQSLPDVGILVNSSRLIKTK